MSDAPSSRALLEPRQRWLKPVAITALTTALVALLARLPRQPVGDGGRLRVPGRDLLARAAHGRQPKDRALRLVAGRGVRSRTAVTRAHAARSQRRRAVGARLALIFLPPFWLGFLWWWHVKAPFHLPRLNSLVADLSGQLLVIALPEEAFYRGYLQSALDEAWKPRIRLLGAELGPSLLVTSTLFALGHLCTEFNAARLAVFFPSLVFGFLRSRTRGIGAGLVFHALCNLFASYLGQSYGFAR